MVMNKISRRHFLAATGAIAGTALLNPLSEVSAETANASSVVNKKLRLAIVGTGGRGTSMW
ncbi:twin-arginine translocation signal domain-containing protein, partial [uncultured Parabacteroides sp.]